jgi:hypothetical protein
MKNYRGYEIKPKLDHPNKEGFVIVKDGCNAAPGAAWFQTEAKAIEGIDRLIAANGHADLWHAFYGHVGLDVEYNVGCKSATIRCEGTKVKADQTIKLVEFADYELSPLEALQLAHALIEGANIAVGNTLIQRTAL